MFLSGDIWGGGIVSLEDKTLDPILQPLNHQLLRTFSCSLLC